MRLQYSIKFVEKVQGSAFLQDEVMDKVIEELRKHLDVFLTEGGYTLDGDVKIDVQMEE